MPVASLTNEPFILVLAGGSSRRMRGRDKLLEEVDGEPLLARQARAARGTGARTLVALPPGAEGRRAALRGIGVETVTVPDAAEGMGHSLSAAVRAVPAGRDVLVVLADMPEIGTTEMARMLEEAAAHPGAVLRATSADGRPGHPVLFPARLRPRLLALSGDTGARDILKGETLRKVALPGEAALTDLDTPEAWDAWRAARART